MYSFFSLRGKLTYLSVALLGLLLATPAAAQAPFDPPGLDRAMAAQDFHVDGLMATDGVVGVGIGLTARGQAAIVIMTEDLWVTGFPRSLDGVPVRVKVTGKIHAVPKPERCSPWPSCKNDPPPEEDPPADVDPSWFDRPVPIGVSTGNEGSCSAGTIGARVTDGTDVYALSNNHVYALSNGAPDDSGINQPGLLDRYDGTDCVPGADDRIGTLEAFVEIFFDGRDNTIDAAIAAVEMMGDGTPIVGTSTPPSDGYGTPSSATVSAGLGQSVQKYGRTTGLTTGTVAVINATVNVTYSGKGTAHFVGQIVVDGDKGGFLKAGDSGSLLVTNGVDPLVCDPGQFADECTVGLLFASGRGGKVAIANPIDEVLGALEGELGLGADTLTIDDGGP